ncbi:hypothetical protein [Nocardia sp. NPDC058705]|uniref:hypothetical protein n=1 Tax=Nocardia sp. NPDC058705 TaxID=3346609 RepID=UPI0036B6158C
MTFLHAKYKIPVVLVVVCRSRATARWAEGPLLLGHEIWPCLVLQPLVLGPHNVPAITDAATASTDLPLAALSAITHASAPDSSAILEALASALLSAGDRDDAQVYTELVELGLGNTQSAELWRKLMSVDLSFFRSETSQRLRQEGLEKGLEKGHDQGVADSILRILARRDVPVPAAAEATISSCHDREQLVVWLDRAITAESIDELFLD